MDGMRVGISLTRKAPTLRRCAGRCPPRGLISLGAALREIVPLAALQRMRALTLLPLTLPALSLSHAARAIVRVTATNVQNSVT